jgi:hypothetical protein
MDAAGGPAISNVSNEPAERPERRHVSMHGHLLLGDGSTHSIQLLDLSYEGCAIATALAFAPGDQIKLSVLRRGAIDAEVRWCADGKAGLAFTPPEAEAKKHWPRRSDRVSLSADVTLRRRGMTSFRVTVSDVSPEGCKVALVERPSVDEHVLVKFDGIEALDSEVCWVEGFTAGLQFERPIHPAVFDLMVARLS